jgi:hypothetical protein
MCLDDKLGLIGFRPRDSVSESSTRYEVDYSPM